MAPAVLTTSSRNYSSWSLRGWLLCRLGGLQVEERVLGIDDETSRAELLHLSPSFLVPSLAHEGNHVWDTLAIAEYVNELKPKAGLLPADRRARAHCRSVCGEMHGGFYNLRSALPMNLRARYANFRVFAGARPDIERICEIWRECLGTYGGPYLFGKPTMADAMYAPVCTRFRTYDVKLDAVCQGYCDTILGWPLMTAWIEAARDEPDELEELDAEF
jgi:glutathione S-transferase